MKGLKLRRDHKLLKRIGKVLNQAYKYSKLGSNLKKYEKVSMFIGKEYEQKRHG